jgi:hypothetical protein
VQPLLGEVLMGSSTDEDDASRREKFLRILFIVVEKNDRERETPKRRPT